MTCTEKARYTSKRKAIRAQRIVSSESGMQMRAYPCGDCGGWHLSSLMLTSDPPPPVKHKPKRGIRLAPGQSLEELAAELRARRCR